MKNNIINKKSIFIFVSIFLIGALILISWKLNSRKQVVETVKVKAAGGTYRKKIEVFIQEEVTPTAAPQPTLTITPTPSPTTPKPIEILPESGDYVSPLIVISASLFLIVVSFIF